MCKKPNQNRNDFHQPAKKVVPELENEVLMFNSKGKENKIQNYEPLAKKLCKHGYSIKTFLKYWTGKPLTDQMLLNLQDALDFFGGEGISVNKKLIIEKEDYLITQ